MARVLYLSYTGLTEPLGVSQVLAYLRRLANDHQITLVTFEKSEALADAALMADRRAACDAAGIRWRPQRYHKRPRLLATAYDLATLLAVGWREARRFDANLIHARAYVTSFAATLLGALIRTPVIFDTRAWWPEELIAAGRLRRGSLLHRIIEAGEALCLRRAAGIVFLTHAAADHLRRTSPAIAACKPVTVIPTCADVDRYQPPADSQEARQRVISVGSILSGWFRQDLLFAAFDAIRRARPDVELAIYSIEEPARIRQAAAAHGFDIDGVEIVALPPADVPAALRRANGMAMFFTGGDAKLGSCPTRMGEALATGLPVLCNGSIGDVGAIVSREDVGVLLENTDRGEAAVAVERFLAMLGSADVAARCRDVAERLFSVDVGVAAYDALYRQTARSA